MDIFYLFKVLLRKKWILILVPLLAAICTLAVKVQLPKYYKSTSQLSTGFTVGEQINFGESERFSSYDAGLRFSNLIEMVNSKMVVSLVSYKLLLHDLTEPKNFRAPELEGEIATFRDTENGKIVETLQNKLSKVELLTSFDPFEKKVIELLEAYGYDDEAIEENSNVSRIGLSDFIKIEFLSEDPELSAFAVNTIANELIRYNSFMKSSRSGESVEFFEELVAQKRKVLSEKTDALKVFKTSRNVMNVEIEGESTLSQIENLETSREEERNKIYRLELSIQDLNDRIRNLGSGQTPSNNRRILDLKSKINRLNSRLNAGANEPYLEDSLTYYRNELQDEMSLTSAGVGGGISRDELVQQRSNLQIELTVANSRLNSINSTLGTLKNNVSGYADTETTIRSLQREVDEASAEYAKALEGYNTAKNTSMISSSSLKQVIAGQPAGEPESSQTLLITIFAGLASFVLCAFTIIVIELLDVSIKSPDHFEEITGIKLIGYLNRISHAVNLNDLLNAKNENPELRKFNHLLKKLRYEVEDANAKVLLVTSPKESEGKTFFIVSMAYSLSLINKRVLLIDTNFKNNSLTQIFLSRAKELKALEEHTYVKNGTPYEPRLLKAGRRSENDEKKEEESDLHTKGIISKTEIKGIDIVGSKGGDYSPAEIFSRKNFKRLINTLSDEYDYIVLEGTSLNEYSDTKELVEFADKVIAVFSANSKMSAADTTSITYLKSLNSKLLGGILNNLDLENIKE